MQMLIITGIYTIFIAIIKFTNSYQFNQWDNITTTISDYTFKFQIPEGMYEKYKSDIH